MSVEHQDNLDTKRNPMQKAMDIVRLKGITQRRFLQALGLGAVLGASGITAQQVKNNHEITRSFDSQVFPNDEEKMYFSEWARINSSLEVKFVTRKEFQALGNRFFVPDDSENGKGGGSLTLPVDLKSKELGSIIYKIQTETFGSKLPSHAAIFQVMKALKQEAGLLGWNRQSKEALRQWNKIGEIPADTESLPGEKIADKLKSGLEEAVFERGIRNFSRYMLAFSKSDFASMNSDDKQHYASLESELSGIEQSLRDSIGLSDLVKQLETARGKQGNTQEISNIEREAAVKILNELNKFPWQKMFFAPDNYSPARVLQGKKTICIGKEYLLSSFLYELGIRQNLLSLPEHVASKIILSDGTKLYADPTLGKMVRYPENEVKKGSMSYYPNFEFNASYSDARITPLVQELNTDSGLMAELYVSMGFDEYMEWNFQKGSLEDSNAQMRLRRAERFFKQTTTRTPTHSSAWQGLGMVYVAKGENTRAIQAFQKAIEINPADEKSSKQLCELYEKNGQSGLATKERDRYLSVVSTIL